jgi:hypothetical protein
LNWTHVILHHSATPDTAGLETDGFRKYHVDARGWRDIAYHAVCELAGDDYEVLCGRPLNWSGAHCPGMNQVALGFCFAGNYEVDIPPDRQLIVGAKHVAGWLDAFGIDDIFNVKPHHEFRQTSCPGRFFDLNDFRRLVEAARR